MVSINRYSAFKVRSLGGTIVLYYGYSAIFLIGFIASVVGAILVALEIKGGNLEANRGSPSATSPLD